MSRFAASTAIVLFLARPAAADVTPQQVWDDFVASMTGFGYSVEATETLRADTLTVSDVVFTLPIPEEDAMVTVSFGGLSFAENGEGTVAVTYPSPMPVTIDIEDPQDPGSAVIEMTHDGFVVTVSGDPGAMDYAYAARSVSTRLTDFTVDGEPLPPEAFGLDVSMGPLSGTSRMTGPEGLRVSEQTISLGDVSYSFNFDDPDSMDAAQAEGSMRAVAFDGTTAIPGVMDPEDMGAAISAGFDLDARFLHEGGTLAFAATAEEGTTTGRTTSDSALIEVSLSADGLRYALEGSGTSLSLAGPEIPLPIEASLAQSGFALAMPVSASEDPQDAGLSLTLGGMTLSPMIWNLFDPGEVLPRDPVTLAFDVVARIAPDLDLFDAEAMEAFEDDALPVQLFSAALREFRLSAAGAEITGTGDFTFDNSDLETFDGLPRPAGALSLSLSGINGLVQNLSAMGLLPEEQVGAAGMMMALFTVPGAEPDTATSVIEINDRGHILANGQRIQ